MANEKQNTIEDKADIDKLQPGDIISIDTYEKNNITGEVINKLDKMIILKTKDIPYLKVLY